MSKKVVSFKLISGDEVIGEETYRDEEAITIKTPLMIVPTPNNNLAFMPSVFTAAPHQTLVYPYRGMAILPFESSAEFTKVYTEKTSGLILS